MSHSRPRGNTPESHTTTNGTSRTSGRLNKKQVVMEEFQEIQDAAEARSYLEKTLLIVPPGEPTSIGLLTTALHHVTEYKGVPKTAIDAIRSIAFLLNELEENALHETVRDSVTVHLNELGKDLKDLVTDTTQQIDKHINRRLALLSEATDELLTTAKTTLDEFPHLGTNLSGDAPAANYKQALLRPPPHVDPRIAAKEGIRIRQFLLTGITRDSALAKTNAAEAKKKVNRTLDETGSNGIKARSALRQSNNDILIEMESDAGAAWLLDSENAKTFCTALGHGLSFKQRPFNVFVYNAPTTLDPSNPDHVKEIAEANNIGDGGLLSLRWVKPTNRRDRPDQRTAHLILTFSNADDANRSILAGVNICNQRLRAVKSKKEPTRCMKCHHWNHIARECIAHEDTCGTCGEKGHWTKDCSNKGKMHCVSCNDDGHASWSRSCPTFLKKSEELDNRTPENNLPFFPSSEPWTWASTPPPVYFPPPLPPPLAIPPQISTRGRNQRERVELHRNSTINTRPLERLSWDRSTPGNPTHHADKPTTPPLAPSANLPNDTTNIIPQLANSQDSMYAWQ